MPLQAARESHPDVPPPSLHHAYLADEEACVRRLLERPLFSRGEQATLQRRARRLVAAVRQRGLEQGGIEAFLHEYNLASEEGVVLMCLAEALLRIPDEQTVDRLIRDQLTGADWRRHLGRSHSLFVNASTWGLMLSGRWVRQPGSLEEAAGLLGRLVRRSGEPLVRHAIRQGMGIIARQFVLGRTLEEAVARGRELYGEGHRFSYDMLGEAALTAADAQRYFDNYLRAIEYLSRPQGGSGPWKQSADSISVKLSALHPRYEFRQRRRLFEELLPRLEQLAGAARRGGLGLTLDAEEAERLNISLELFEALYHSQACAGWEGLGLALQAYQKRAPSVLDWLQRLALAGGRRIPLRLVKGAYWDTEIKRAQQLGLRDYPVYTRKAATDLAYLHCARRVLQAPRAFHAQFATHNAHTIASLLCLDRGRLGFELQRLHGMGGSLYASLAEQLEAQPPCRIYAPVGGHQELLPYLVRRLLENGANSSFVNRLEDAAQPVAEVVRDPAERLRAAATLRHPAIPPPPALYGPGRVNARGFNLDDPAELAPLMADLQRVYGASHQACPLVNGRFITRGEAQAVSNPACLDSPAGSLLSADGACVEEALTAGSRGAEAWAQRPAQERARILRVAAGLLEGQAGELAALCAREGGRTLPDALAEVREAVDFCRYYAQRLTEAFGPAQRLSGPTGEENHLSLHGRGLFVCISPWNFPIAIFTGQIAAALAAGNGVIAKPASQTPLVGLRIVQLLQAAGVPEDALHYLPGPGAQLGAQLLDDPRIAGVAFTGSTETARAINLRLARRPGPILPLIAETGGQNAMIVDSSALPEQAVSDIVESAFNSAGQRCSALRVLFVQEEIAPRILDMLTGAMEQLRLGDPRELDSDLGPLIDLLARQQLLEHVRRMRTLGRQLYGRGLEALGELAGRGCFFSPHLFELEGLGPLRREVFGPILHLIRYQRERLDEVVRQIRATGYGLTLGIHSRVESTIDSIRRRLPVGNVYVNRNMIGAVVGVQPFGGEGLSGTGPKVGGPYSLLRYATERSVSINTAAVGGNAHLLAIDE